MHVNLYVSEHFAIVLDEFNVKICNARFQWRILKKYKKCRDHTFCIASDPLYEREYNARIDVWFLWFLFINDYNVHIENLTATRDFALSNIILLLFSPCLQTRRSWLPRRVSRRCLATRPLLCIPLTTATSISMASTCCILSSTASCPLCSMTLSSASSEQVNKDAL